jgi:putative SOS response-associated peptidase YedK
MCGRFTATAPAEILAEEFGLEELPPQLPARFNIAPTQPVPVVTNWSHGALELFRWGLVPSWAEDPAIGARLINARAETLIERASFRDAYERRRCLVLADGFFEWKRIGKERTPMYARLRSRRPFAFAGLWEGWLAPTGELIRTCAIITTTPNELLAPVHDRMPVILRPEARAAWLDPALRDTEPLDDLLAPYPAAEMELYPVSSDVNSPANDHPRCIAPDLPRGTLPLFPE